MIGQGGGERGGAGGVASTDGEVFGFAGGEMGIVYAVNKGGVSIGEYSGIPFSEKYNLGAGDGAYVNITNASNCPNR